jgi:hypothetical protein
MIGVRRRAGLEHGVPGDPAWPEQRADQFSAATEAILFRRSQLRVGEFRFDIFEHPS